MADTFLDGETMRAMAAGPPKDECGDCVRCVDALCARQPLPPGEFVDPRQCRMFTCIRCGNKRCPKADWHGYRCTGSNDVGQVGVPETAEDRITRDREDFAPGGAADVRFAVERLRAHLEAAMAEAEKFPQPNSFRWMITQVLDELAAKVDPR